MTKINDIYNDLDSDIDLSDILGGKKLKVDNLKERSTNDIKTNLKSIHFFQKQHPGIHKNRTKNFDSVLISKKLKTIDVSERPKFYERLFLQLKGKMSLKGIPLSVFKKREVFSKKFLKIAIYGIIILGALLFIDKSVLENRINTGYSKIISIKDNSGDIEYVKSQINNAKLDFVLSSILFKPFLLIPNHNIENGYHVLEGGKNLTKLLDSGVQLYTGTKKLLDEKGGIENVNLTNLLSNIKEDLSEINILLYQTILSYEKIGQLPDINLNNKLLFAKNKLKGAYGILDTINKDFSQFLGLLGHESEKKYLILFQNNDEIRATGGFIGSLATVTIKNGQVTDFIKDDVYAYEWEINKVFKDKQKAPEGLNQITKTFGLRDANYFVDFGDSSKSINYFLEKINKKVDGIIYINQNTILDFLKLIGDVKVDGLDEIITEENFSLVISTLVEAQAFKVGTLGSPKQILFDFANKFVDILKTEKDYFAYLDIIIKNIKSRDIVIYSFNSEENNLLWKLGLNGSINYSDTFDYSYPVYTSVGGNKSDRYIETKYKKDIVRNTDCSIDTTFSLNRTHFFSKFEEEKVNILLDKYPLRDKTRKDVINIQGKGVNKAYVRVVLPKDIEVFQKTGMKINYFENNTVVSFYINTRVLESTNFEIKYRLQNKNCSDYDFKLYKQPGIRDFKVDIYDGNYVNKNIFVQTDYFYN